MSNREKVIKELNESLEWCDVDDNSNGSVAVKIWAVRNSIELLKKQEAKPPIHIHEEYPEHDWERDENGDIDDFAYDGDYHNGPSCKRCYYSFCIHCDPNGWNKKPCIIDRYKCPKCERYIVRRTKFCSDCGQELKWE